MVLVLQIAVAAMFILAIRWLAYGVVFPSHDTGALSGEAQYWMVMVPYWIGLATVVGLSLGSVYSTWRLSRQSQIVRERLIALAESSATSGTALTATLDPAEHLRVSYLVSNSASLHLLAEPARQPDA